MLLPDQGGTTHPRLLIVAGKNTSIDLVDRDPVPPNNMGHFNASGDTQIVQHLENVFPWGLTDVFIQEPGNYSNPVYFNGCVYFAPVADAIQPFQLNNGVLSRADPSSATYTYPGGTLAISAKATATAFCGQRRETAQA
jgi:hypothetical protein